MRTVVAFLLVFIASMARSEDFVFENHVVRWTITSAGQNQSLVEKQTGRSWGVPGPMALVKKSGRWHPIATLTRRDESWRMDFGPATVTADCRILRRERYFIVELTAVRGEGIEDFCFARLDAAIQGNYGGWLNVKWNPQFAVAVLGLSDRVDTSGPPGWAMVKPEFGMIGQKAALVAAPKAELLDVIQEVERDEHLPSPKIAGRWAKTSPDVRRGYLFTDLTEANADETIRYAKLGEFGYVMAYDGTWSSSLGSYPINTKNFPRGEESLKAVVDKCHAAGLKVGLHMLTSFVGKNDPLATPRPDARLLKDAEAHLAADVDAKTVEIPAAGPLETFPREGAFYGDARQGMDLAIDDEIVHYGDIGGPGGRTFLRCTRGFAGTRPAPHKAEAAVHHLCERYGCYLVDLRTSLKDQVADRVAGVFNRCGFDMIYFDGGECNGANGPYWYWVSQQQMAIYERIRRDILVQGSGGTPWTWHIFARGCCDDFAAVAPKQYLDLHKIADSWQHYTNSFMPAELGWWGFLEDTPHNPATSPDEVECYAVRMLALDTPVSLETNLAALKRNGRTEELLRLLGQYERLRLSGTVPPAVREKLRTGEWHLPPGTGKMPVAPVPDRSTGKMPVAPVPDRSNGKMPVAPGPDRGAGKMPVAPDRPVFQPIRYDTQRVTLPGEVRVTNALGAQPLRFRLQAVPSLALPGDKANQILLPGDPPMELKWPEPKAAMPGALTAKIDFLKKPLNLLKHRALAVKLRVEGATAAKPYAVLNVQLESGGKNYRDYYVDLDFTGEKTVVLPEPTTERMLPEFRAAGANYAFKAAMYGFTYQGIVAMNLRWMRTAPGAAPRCTVERIEALAESDAPLKSPEIVLNGRRCVVPADLRPGDYVESWANGPMRIFDRNGVKITESRVDGATGRHGRLAGAGPEHGQDARGTPSETGTMTLAAGENRLTLGAKSPGTAKLTVITLGEPADASLPTVADNEDEFYAHVDRINSPTELTVTVLDLWQPLDKTKGLRWPQGKAKVLPAERIVTLEDTFVPANAGDRKAAMDFLAKMVRQSDGEVVCAGSSVEVKEAAGKKVVRVTACVQVKDGRTLNNTLVRQGLATTTNPFYKAWELEAKQKRLGIWRQK